MKIALLVSLIIIVVIILIWMINLRIPDSKAMDSASKVRDDISDNLSEDLDLYYNIKGRTIVIYIYNFDESRYSISDLRQICSESIPGDVVDRVFVRVFNKAIETVQPTDLVHEFYAN